MTDTGGHTSNPPHFTHNVCTPISFIPNAKLAWIQKPVTVTTFLMFLFKPAELDPVLSLACSQLPKCIILLPKICLFITRISWGF